MYNWVTLAMIDGSFRCPKQTRVQCGSGVRPVCVQLRLANSSCVLVALCSLCVHVAFTQNDREREGERERERERGEREREREREREKE